MRWVIDPSKLASYLLDLKHRDGGPKARFFLGRGFRPGQPDMLATALLAHPLQAALMGRTPHAEGHKLVYECSIRAADGSRPCIRSVWIEAHGGASSRLVTAYPMG